jgi:hypothetical protein
MTLGPPWLLLHLDVIRHVPTASLDADNETTMVALAPLLALPQGHATEVAPVTHTPNAGDAVWLVKERVAVPVGDPTGATRISIELLEATGGETANVAVAEVELPEVMALEPTVRVPPMLAEAGRERGMMTPIAKTMASAEMRIGRRMAAIIGGAPSRRSHDVWA